jgi:hypothetical protein
MILNRMYKPKEIKINDELTVRLTERELPLITMDAKIENIILTAENYCKWNCLYLLYPTGYIKAIDPNILDDSVMYKDHVWKPDDIIIWANKNNYVVDEQFFEMLVGRWEIEVKERY